MDRGTARNVVVGASLAAAVAVGSGRLAGSGPLAGVVVLLCRVGARFVGGAVASYLERLHPWYGLLLSVTVVILAGGLSGVVSQLLHVLSTDPPLVAAVVLSNLLGAVVAVAVDVVLMLVGGIPGGVVGAHAAREAEPSQ